MSSEGHRHADRPMDATPPSLPVFDPVELGDLWALVRTLSGRDFELYKPGTTLRRLARRLRAADVPSLAAYIDRLRTDPHEVEHLVEDLLISVTSFFRDIETFDILAKIVLPELIRAANGSSLRLWVPGCATGEEAYSLAILTTEALARTGGGGQARIFATDIHRRNLNAARRGVYPAHLAGPIGRDRLERFFSRHGDSYTVSAALRGLCVFSENRLGEDPPFPGLDLISCRNVLIYLQRPLQDRILLLFHFALRPGGFLVMGLSEGVGGHHQLFETYDKKHHIYVRTDTQPALPLLVRRWSRFRNEPDASQDAGASRAVALAATGRIPLGELALRTNTVGGPPPPSRAAR